MRNVRCLLCDNLVSPILVPDFPYMPYQIKRLSIGNRNGCICSTCVGYLYDLFDSDLSALKEFNPNIIPFKPVTPRIDEPTLLPKYTVKPATPSTKSSSTAKKEEEDDDEEDETFAISSASQKPKTAQSEDLNISLASTTYACLDYSLDTYLEEVEKKVFGQTEQAKMLLYTLYYNQMSNLIEEFEGDEIKRSHIIMLGNTGVGKTFLVTTVADLFQLPHIIFNATSITSAAYIGDKVENLLEQLYIAADKDLERAQKGIIILDEIDKKRSQASSDGRDVVGKAVQQELLKILEPNTIYLKSIKQNFYTGNLTVVMMGAFVGIEDIVSKRLKSKTIGFKSNDDKINAGRLRIKEEDVIEYGFIPEFIGRSPVIIQLNPLTPEVIRKIIMTRIQETAILFHVKDVKLTINSKYVDSLVDMVMKAPTGARSVHAMIYKLFYPALYRIFQSQGNGLCRITDTGETELLLSTPDSDSPIHYKFENEIDKENRSELEVEE